MTSGDGSYRYVNLKGSITRDWTTAGDEPPIIGCWVCERPLMGKQKPRLWTGNTAELIGGSDRIFVLLLSGSEKIDHTLRRRDSPDEDIIKTWMMCSSGCWDRAREVLMKLIEQATENQPIMTTWSEDFSSLTGLDE